MYNEAYVQIMDSLYECIRPQKSVTYTFNAKRLENAKRLFMTGETNISPLWKTEPDYQMLYRRIDDSLRSDVADKNRFCLDFSGERCKYPKIAFKKLVAPFKTPMFILNNCSDHWRFGISAKAENLKIYGYLRVCVEVRLKKEGVSKYSTVEAPDQVFEIAIPEGSYDWQDLTKNISIPQNDVASVCYYVEGEDYEGKVYFEEPVFASDNEINVLGQFLPHSEDRPYVNWMGQNLSRTEWIGLKISINDKTVFDGEIFERCHRFSEAEISLPDNVIISGENTITFTCTSDYRDAAGYILKEWGFITESKDFVISVPEIITAGKEFYICVEGKKGDKIDFVSSLVSLTCEPYLTNDGLNVLSLVCNTHCNDVIFEINGEKINISRCVLREDDGVITGTGDFIYISIDERNVTSYLKWYLSNRLGNMMTLRPSYRWNGTRIPEADLYNKTANFLDSMGIYYSHMLDGRELPGCNANPTVEEIKTDHFLGRQLHEEDGQFCYWGKRDITNKLSDQMFYDLFLRMNQKYADRMHNRYIPNNIHYTDQMQYIFSSLDMPNDMQGCAELFIKKLKDTQNGNMRHTGPSTLFKYFYQAGFKFVGAELMYSPTEITISALRGANKVYGGKIGAHHAVQWSTSPHDTESRYRRYRLALFISYIQGIDEINTEEGLWHLEEYYSFHHRFTSACENHKKQQQDFYRYLSSHTRRGRFYTPIAFLSGRYDGWRCFGRYNTWGNYQFGMGDPEKAWDILRFYYPKSVLDALYFHNCPDKELGYYSGTPYGNVDIIPIEAENYDSYRLLVAPGYNKACIEDLKKLKDYVIRGGKLLIGWPQLSITVDRNKILSYEHTYYDQKTRVFIQDTYCNNPVSICETVDYDDVLLYTDSKRPLVTVKRLGKGYIYFVNAKEYSGSKAVELAYLNMLEKLTVDCLNEEKIYARGDRNIQFTVFEKEKDSCDIYFIATDWHKERPDGIGTIILNNTEYSVMVPWGQTVKVSVYGESAIYPEKDENEVLFFDGSTAKVQGVGLAKFVLCKNNNIREITVDFTINSVQKIKI